MVRKIFENIESNKPKNYIDNYFGNIFMIVAPSGTGKSTLIKALLDQNKEIKLSISHTTRMPRKNEKDGEHYYFITINDFLNKRESGYFFESAEVHGNYYGTSRIWIDKQVKNGQDIILEIDCQGAQQVKSKINNTTEIFILPPSIEELKDRLKNRNQDEKDIIYKRLFASYFEISHVVKSEYVIINEDFDKTLSNLQCIIVSKNLNFKSQYKKNPELFMNFGIFFPFKISKK